jgi:hypothetical protein
MCCLVAVDVHASLLLFSFNAVVAPIPGCGSPSLCPEGHSRRLVIGLVGLGVGLLIGADLLLLIVACTIL